MRIEEFLDHYDIGRTLEILPCKGGTANQNFRVETDRGSFFAKCRVPRLSKSDHVRFEHALLRHLAKDGLPVFPPEELRDRSDTFLLDEDRIWEVTRFCEGKTFAGSSREIESAALTLGRIHCSMASLDVPSSIMDRPIHENRAQIADSLEQAASVLSHPSLVKQREAMARCFARLEDEYYGRIDASLQRGVIHGDFHPLNMLFDEGGSIAGVFDFNAAGWQIPLRDVVDGLITFGRERPEKFSAETILTLTRAPDFNLDNMELFARAFHSQRPLSGEERQATPLMLRVRWLAVKLDPIRHGKVNDEGAQALLQDAHRPLEWLDENDEAVREMLDRL